MTWWLVAGDPTRAEAVYYFRRSGRRDLEADRKMPAPPGVMLSDGFLKTASVGADDVSPIRSQRALRGHGQIDHPAPTSPTAHVRSLQVPPTAASRWDPLRAWPTPVTLGEIRVHPKNPDIVYVAALGHAFGPKPGPPLSLHRPAARAGNWCSTRADRRAVDITLDRASNPDILYATATHRNFWELSSAAAPAAASGRRPTAATRGLTSRATRCRPASTARSA